MTNRKRASNSWKQRRWAVEYRQRIINRQEKCRECGLVSPFLTFAHMIPESQGGKGNLLNMTILCVRCQNLQGDNIWPHQVSLLIEILENPVLPEWIECSKSAHNVGMMCIYCLHRDYVRKDMGISHRRSKHSKPARTRGIPFNPKTLEKEVGTPVPSPAEIAGTIATRIGKLEVDLANALARIDVLENQPKAPAGDEMTRKCLEFLAKHEGLKFNTGTIAGNLDSVSGKISDKLKIMAARGQIKMAKSEGQSTMYWYETPDTLFNVKEEE